MHKPTSCNGWTNHETWLANLWLTNDQGSYAVLQEAHRQGDDPYDRAKWLEKQLRDQLDEIFSEPHLWSDLLYNAFSRINWVEVVEYS